MEKINIAELLRDCPKGMELDCTTWENVTFEKVMDNKIFIKRNDKPTFDTTVVLNKYGCTTDCPDEKCRIFPKGKTTWEGFNRPFKDGDILIHGDCTFIYNGFENNMNYGTYVIIDCYGAFAVNIPTKKYGTRLATEEEKQKLFDAIKANGYRWNAETKTLEKLPKFKVGDRVKHISAYASGIVVKIADKGYYIDYPKGEGFCYISFTLEKDYELTPNKFDINTLKAFDKVLVRTEKHHIWFPSLFGLYNKDSNTPFMCCNGFEYTYCIPYEGNEHLLGTTNDCDDFYKTWEK